MATNGDFPWPQTGTSSGHQWGLSHGHGHHAAVPLIAIAASLVNRCRTTRTTANPNQPGTNPTSPINRCFEAQMCWRRSRQRHRDPSRSNSGSPVQSVASSATASAAPNASAYSIG